MSTCRRRCGIPRYEFNFRLTHRFLGNLRQGSFTDQLDNLFGLDNGAIIGLELRFAPIRHVQAIVYRNNLSKTIQFAGQYDAIRQGESFPVSLSAIGSIEGTNNFRSGHSDDEGEDDEHDHGVATGHRSPALGGVVSRTFSDWLAVYAVPMWVHHVIPDPERDTFYIGVGGRARISRNVYVVGEVSPRVNGFAPGDLGIRVRDRAAGGRPHVSTDVHQLPGQHLRSDRAGWLPRHDLFGFQPGAKILLSGQSGGPINEEACFSADAIAGVRGRLRRRPADGTDADDADVHNDAVVVE